jgi:methoxymalonate biosynthesis acyl carrier protein
LPGRLGRPGTDGPPEVALQSYITHIPNNEVGMTDERILFPIRHFMAGTFSGRNLTDEDDIFALGFGNSLFAIQLVNFVESKFGIEIDSEDLEMANFRSINSISGLVERKLSMAAS